MHARTLSCPFPLDLVATLAPLRRGPYDPTTAFLPREMWRATRTPEGPATLRLVQESDRIRARAWGPGAEWALDAVPRLIGFEDDPSEFVPVHAVLRDLHRRLPGVRLGRTDAVAEALVASVIEQKVAGKEAWRSYARLVHRYGEQAPGPGELVLPPDPALLASLPYYTFHPLGIEWRRADTIRRACAHRRLEETCALPLTQAYRRLTAIEGVGRWTAAEVARIALGDRDAVSVGDYHLKNQVAWVLAGEPRGSDERMLELLQPYRGQRARAIRLIELSGVSPPRYGPRMPLRSISRI